jgi:hypothetical protein
MRERSGRLAVALIALVTAIYACREVEAPYASSPALRAAKSTSSYDMSVTAALPDSATQDTTLDVVVNGSGFVAGTTATWALSGLADSTQVRTNSTRYVNSRQLVANITIAAEATVGNWDVVVAATGKKGGIGSELFIVKQRGNVSPTPTDTWKLPLDDAGLSFRSDRQYSDGTYSVYTSGICNVGGAIFDGSSGGTNDGGDATIHTILPTNGRCGRRFTLMYPDGLSETVASFANIRDLESTSYSIPIGTTAFRRLTIFPGGVFNKGTLRCSKLLLGEFPTGGPGSDSVAVTRIDESTWRVQSQPAPKDLAYCDTNGKLYHMQVSFIVVSSRPLH